MDTKPVVVDFPLRGEWVAYHTPAERVPSHGTDQLAQRFDLSVVLKNALTFDPRRPDALRMVLGNYLVLRKNGSDVHALIAHARTGSIRVAEGEVVSVGTHLADVGHSGNSTAPHLHFHLMDGPSVLSAKGIPCAFRNYLAWRDGGWVAVVDAVPAKREFIRSTAEHPLAPDCARVSRAPAGEDQR